MVFFLKKIKDQQLSAHNDVMYTYEVSIPNDILRSPDVLEFPKGGMPDDPTQASYYMEATQHNVFISFPDDSHVEADLTAQKLTFYNYGISSKAITMARKELYELVAKDPTNTNVSSSNEFKKLIRTYEDRNISEMMLANLDIITDDIKNNDSLAFLKYQPTLVQVAEGGRRLKKPRDGGNSATSVGLSDLLDIFEEDHGIFGFGKSTADAWVPAGYTDPTKLNAELNKIQSYDIATHDLQTIINHAKKAKELQADNTIEVKASSVISR